MISPRYIPDLLRNFGPRWLTYRAAYATRVRTGGLRRRFPAKDWDALPLSSFIQDSALSAPERYLVWRKHEAPAFFFSHQSRREFHRRFPAWDQDAERTPAAEASLLAQGRMSYFGRTVAEGGFPPDWHANPLTGSRVPSDVHWSRIDDFADADIKVIWEPSRFAFAYTLARAWWRIADAGTGNKPEPNYAELFWSVVEDWRRHNPPQLGPNWKCGQETAFRLMAWCFALYAFIDAPATTADRLQNLAQMIAISAERIAGNIDYALSQRNNHGISEALGLYTTGVLFPEFRSGQSWRQTGRRVLESAARELIYEDGCFAQHSVNYHRLMLHSYLWAVRLGDLHGEPFSDALKQRVGSACAFLHQIVDDTSGGAPNYGANDGALMLPLNNSDFRDFRPAVQASHYLINGARIYPAGPWDEDLLWLFGPRSLDAAVESSAQLVSVTPDLRADHGGYYTLRSSAGFAFTRAATFVDRPSQADMLHVDLWWRGQNIAVDAGTFSYNASESGSDAPFANHELARTAHHNTVSVDGLDQMERAGRFLWLPWLAGKASCFVRSAGEHLVYWEGEHDGYRRIKSPVVHRRGILRAGDDCWVVIDKLSSNAAHQYRLHWLLADLPFAWDEANKRLTLHTARGGYALQIVDLTAAGTSGSCSIVRADPHTARGWRSLHYFARDAALSIDFKCRAETAIMVTVFSPSDWHVRHVDAALEAAGAAQRATIQFGDGAGHLIHSAQFASATPSPGMTDRLVCVADRESKR